MFSNIGDKIKKLAQIITWFGIVGSLIYAFYMVKSLESNILTFIYTLSVIITSIILGYLFYGFGQLINNTEVILEYERKISKNIKKIAENSEEPYVIKAMKKSEKNESKAVDLNTLLVNEGGNNANESC